MKPRLSDDLELILVGYVLILLAVWLVSRFW
jgi:hypothetical protein